MASGRPVEVPLAATQAYLDLRTFGVMPYAGGTFEQPAHLLEDMRVIAAAVNRAERRRSDADRAALERLRARRR